MTARRTAAAGAALMLTLAACTTGTEHESTVGVKERPLSTVVSPAAPAAAEAGRTSTAADSLRASAAGAPAQAPANGAATSPPSRPAPDPGGVGINPFVDTAVDALSTFAVDVDTGAYTLTRRALGLDRRPDPASVRPEEFVNWFEPGYAPPDGAGFSVHVDGGPTPFAPSPDRRVVRVGLATRAADQRQPLTLTLVIDVSGSMRENGKLELVKEAVELLVNQLDGEDRVGVVVYSNEARSLLGSTSGASKQKIIDAVRALAPQQSTNAEAGLTLGYEQARAAFRAGTANRVALLSDGVANVGDTTPDGILAKLRGEADRGLSLATFGFGFGQYNDPLMERLADSADGFYAYVDDRKEAERLFVTQLSSTVQTAAKDAKVQVEFDAAKVARYRLIGFDNRAVADGDFTDDSVDAGEVGVGRTVTALYELELAPGAAGQLGEVRVRWADPETGAVSELEREIAAAGLSGSWDSAPARFQLAATAAAFAEVLRASPYVQSSLGDVAAAASAVAGRLPEDADAAELAKLTAKAAAFR